MAPLFHDFQHAHNHQQQRLCLFVQVAETLSRSPKQLRHITL